jgi:hypothetical protein
MRMHYRFFNFLVRRVIAVGFIVGGALVGFSYLGALLPGGTIVVDGSPNDDLVLRIAVVGFPFLLSALGVALFRAKPFNPHGSPD